MSITDNNNKNVDSFNSTRNFNIPDQTQRTTQPIRRQQPAEARRVNPAPEPQSQTPDQARVQRARAAQGTERPTAERTRRVLKPTSRTTGETPIPSSVRKPVEKTAVMPTAPASGNTKQATRETPIPSSVRKPVEKKASIPTAPASGKMMQTREAAIRTGALKSGDPVVKKEKKERGEGTNTVISVVKAVVYIMCVLVVSVFLAIGIIKVGNDVFAFVKSDEIVEITIPAGATRDDVAKILNENGVISYPKIFSIYSKVRGDDGEYLAGTYSVSPMMNFDALIAEFKPKVVYGTCEITIPEGYTTDEIIDLFIDAGIGTRDGYIDVIQNGDFDYWFVRELDERGVDDGRIYRLDGYLFPDTYEFYLNSSEWTVVNKLLKRFSQIFTKEYRDQCDVLGYTADEIVNLASMIEKEAASPSEFFMVSSVFHNRLNAPSYYPNFESDATVVYAIQHETGERNVDLNYDTPYNTYKYSGFTPGPISNPSASAILAALSPQNSNYYFFVSNNGVTYFSSSKAQHDAYVAQFKAEKAQQGAATNRDNPQN